MTPTSLPSSPTIRVPDTAAKGELIPILDCPLGMGLRAETADFILASREQSALVMSPTNEFAGQIFPDLDGWIRVLGAPSLEALNSKAERADRQGIPYEVLGYGLETGESTPDEEWQDLLSAAQAARQIADQFGKLLLIAPGFRLMSENVTAYPAMAAQADIWVLQTQVLQAGYAAETYRQEVDGYVQLIRSGNPEIKIWAQITIPPEQELEASYWLMYHHAIADLVDGTYLGLYTWDTLQAEDLLALMESIYVQVCGH